MSAIRWGNITLLLFFLLLVSRCDGNSLRLNQEAEEDNNSIKDPTKIQGVVGGTPVSPGEFPAFVQYGGRALCGATLIWEDIIIGAVHCGVPSNKIVYIKGNTTKLNKGLPRGVIDYSEHPRFRNYLFHLNRDYLIMKLNLPVPASVAEPAKLNADDNYPQIYQGLTAMGYGVTCSGCADAQTELLKVGVQYVDPLLCNVAYGGGLRKSCHLCAAASGKDTCQGDSGGPIFDEEKRLLGITSFGRGCASRFSPGVYARISGEIDWINGQICCLSSNPPPGCECHSRSNAGPINVCFSPVATTIVKGKGKVAMKDLAVGDHVMTMNGKYKKIYTILHFDKSTPTEFLQIHTTSTTEKQHPPLELTARHMIFVAGKLNPIPASHIRVGDYVKSLHGILQVTNITSVIRNGYYNPLNGDGTIIVDEIMTSTYSIVEEGSSSENIQIAGFNVLSQQTFSNIVYTPYRLFCMGISLELCKVHDPIYNQIGRKTFSFWRQQHTAVQILVFAALLIVFLLCSIFLVNPLWSWWFFFILQLSISTPSKCYKDKKKQ